MAPPNWCCEAPIVMMATIVAGTVHHHETSPAREASIIHTAQATAAAMTR
jgi:hypothetical protein